MLAGTFHIGQYAGVTGEVAVDIGLSLLAININLLGQTKGAHTVDQTKVDRLGAAALLGGDCIQFNPEYFGGGGLVHVEVVLEGIQQTGVLRQVGHDAQLDLRVVGGQYLVTLGGDKRLTDTTPLGAADRNVLQVRVGG